MSGQQSLEFSDLDDLIQASVDQGISTEVIDPVRTLIRRQIAAGHGKDAFARIYEGIKEHRSMTTDPRPPVTVIGLGPMGQAMARALQAGGHPVTVWNRTPSRGRPRRRRGAACGHAGRGGGPPPIS